MIEIEKEQVLGWEHAIRGMRNPMNSWSGSDSEKDQLLTDGGTPFFLGKNDLKLMKKLCKAGTDHRKFMRMIVVYMDITAPLYWWKEFDTYKVGTVANSCSTMHKIASKEFTMDDFSTDHLGIVPNCDPMYMHAFEGILFALNEARRCYLDTKDKAYWWQMIQLLPSSYNQRRTVMLNYEVLANIYKSRKNHKLSEWVRFCEWIEQNLPFGQLITEGEK